MGYTPIILSRFCVDWDDWDYGGCLEEPLLIVQNPQLLINIGTHKRGEYVETMQISPYETTVTISNHGLIEELQFAPEILTEDEF